VGHRQVSKGRLLRDRAQLLGALRDHRGGKAGHLAESEVALLIENIERRLESLEERLQEIGEA
jgi:hypothetical protein